MPKKSEDGVIHWPEQYLAARINETYYCGHRVGIETAVNLLNAWSGDAFRDREDNAARAYRDMANRLAKELLEPAKEQEERCKGDVARVTFTRLRSQRACLMRSEARMRNAIEALLKAVDRGAGGVAVVLCPDFGLRDWLVEQVENLLPEEAQAVRVPDVEAAFAEPTRLVLLIPKNEWETVLDLDASQERILQEPARSQPIVLFLLRDGDGERALAVEAPSLRSWIGGNYVDPDKLAEIDVPKQRAAFKVKHGETPEAWLVRWRSGVLPKSGENYRTAFDTLLIERREAS